MEAIQFHLEIFYIETSTRVLLLRLSYLNKIFEGNPLSTVYKGMGTVRAFHLKRSLVNPPAVDEATSLWYEIVIFTSHSSSINV